MKKSRIFMATGALALVISAIFATKANKRFTPGITTGFLQDGDGYVKGFSGALLMTTVPLAGYLPAAVAIVTSAHNFVVVGAENLVKGSSAGHQLYIKP